MTGELIKYEIGFSKTTEKESLKQKKQKKEDDPGSKKGKKLQET